MGEGKSQRDAITDVFRSFAGQAANLVIPRPYIDFCGGDHLAALLLSQILYWSDRTEDPDGWFVKSYEEWQAELAMTKYQVNRALNGDKRSKNGHPGLKAVGVETDLRRSNFHKGAATLHYRVNAKKLRQAIMDYFGISVVNNVDNGDVNIVNNDVVNNVENVAVNIVENVIIDSTEITKEGESRPPKKDVQPVPENYRRMMVANMATHPLWEAYCDEMKFQKKPVFTPKNKGIAFDLERQGFTPDEVRALVKQKLRERKRDYKFDYLANDLALSVRSEQTSPSKTLVMPEDVPLPEPSDYFNIAGVVS